MSLVCAFACVLADHMLRICFHTYIEHVFKHFYRLEKKKGGVFVNMSIIFVRHTTMPYKYNGKIFCVENNLFSPWV